MAQITNVQPIYWKAGDKSLLKCFAGGCKNDVTHRVTIREGESDFNLCYCRKCMVWACENPGTALRDETKDERG